MPREGLHRRTFERDRRPGSMAARSAGRAQRLRDRPVRAPVASLRCGIRMGVSACATKCDFEGTNCSDSRDLAS